MTQTLGMGQEEPAPGFRAAFKKPHYAALKSVKIDQYPDTT